MFGNCSSLTAINFEGDAPKFADNAFENVTATVSYPIENTTWTEDKKQNYGGNLTWSSYSLANRLAIIPELTDSVYVIGSGKGATIKCTGIFKYFVDAAVDGKTLDPSFYTAENGFTILTILSAYLDTLSAGDHVVILNYTYGSVDTVLKVVKNDSSAATVTGNGVRKVSVPATKDETNIVLWLLIGCFTVSFSVWQLKKKRKLN